MDNPATTVPLVLFRVLSDRGGAPAGLLLDLAPGLAAGPEQLQEVLGSAAFADLSFAIDIYFHPVHPAGYAEALQGAGCQPLAPGMLMREDDKLVKQDVPASAVLIEGDWFMSEPPKATGAQAASRALALQLAALVAADAHTAEIEALLRKDPTLSYHLLRLVNSLGMGVGRRITNFSQAILLLGRQQLRRWINLMLFAARKDDQRSAMLLARVAVRGRLLELLVKARGQDKHAQDQAFIAGMFSLLGVLFGMALEEVLAPLSMSEAVHDAVLGYMGELGTMLRLCEAVEAGDFDAAAGYLNALHLTPAEFNAALVDANYWMLSAVRAT